MLPVGRKVQNGNSGELDQTLYSQAVWGTLPVVENCKRKSWFLWFALNHANACVTPFESRPIVPVKEFP
jgi:hypothetical protein